MKKLITTCVLLTSITMVSFAQSRATRSSASGSAAAAAPATKSATATKATSSAPTAEQLAEKHAKSLQAQYGLNAEQYNNVKAADVEYYRQEEAAAVNGGKVGQGQQMQMNMGRDQRYQNAMSPEQWTKYQANNKVSR